METISGLCPGPFDVKRTRFQGGNQVLNHARTGKGPGADSSLDTQTPARKHLPQVNRDRREKQRECRLLSGGIPHFINSKGE